MKPESSQGQQKMREKVEPKKKGVKAGKKVATAKKGAKKPRADRPAPSGGPGVPERPPSPLLPLRHFVDNPSQMIDQLFQALGREELAAMQPTILQGLPVEEVKQLCLRQLEAMTKQDILDILSGCEVKDHKPVAIQESTSVVVASSAESNVPSDVTKGQEVTKEGERMCAEAAETLELFPATEDLEMLAMDEPPLVTPDKPSVKPAPNPKGPTSSEGDLATNLTKMQMEILELQLRRRAIKALLRSQKGPGEEDDDDDDDDDDDEEEEEEMILMNEEKG